MDASEPLISITLPGSHGEYRQGETLQCEYQIDAIESSEVLAVEASVLWYTEGKGEEDIGVHFFERRTHSDTVDGDLRPLRHFEAELPNSPLSYFGAIVKIRWCVRVRLFLRRGKEMHTDKYFHLIAAT